MIASFGVIVGMWLERFLIVVPSLCPCSCPTITVSALLGGNYDYGGAFAAMGLLYFCSRSRADYLDLGTETGHS